MQGTLCNGIVQSLTQYIPENASVYAHGIIEKKISCYEDAFSLSAIIVDVEADVVQLHLYAECRKPEPGGNARLSAKPHPGVCDTTPSRRFNEENASEGEVLVGIDGQRDVGRTRRWVDVLPLVVIKAV